MICSDIAYEMRRREGAIDSRDRENRLGAGLQTTCRSCSTMLNRPLRRVGTLATWNCLWTKAPEGAGSRGSTSEENRQLEDLMHPWLHTVSIGLDCDRGLVAYMFIGDICLALVSSLLRSSGVKTKWDSVVTRGSVWTQRYWLELPDKVFCLSFIWGGNHAIEVWQDSIVRWSQKFLVEIT